MGSQAVQSQLWGRFATDWATIQERTGLAGYQFALSLLNLTNHETLLDIGCGSGLFCSLAAPRAGRVTGLDATPELIAEARRRLPGPKFLVGEMEELPFPDAAYDVVTGFNSFQYAGSMAAAFREAHRVLKPAGRLVVMIWGNKEECEALSYLNAVGSLAPPPPPGANGPFALSEGQLLEKKLGEAGFQVTRSSDVPAVWDYPDAATALRGLLSAGPAVRAIEHSGHDKVAERVKATMEAYTRPDGHVVYRNKFRVVLTNRLDYSH